MTYIAVSVLILFWWQVQNVQQFFVLGSFCCLFHVGVILFCYWFLKCIVFFFRCLFVAFVKIK